MPPVKGQQRSCSSAQPAPEQWREGASFKFGNPLKKASPSEKSQKTKNRRQSTLLKRLDINVLDVASPSPSKSPGRPSVRRTRRMSMAALSGSAKKAAAAATSKIPRSASEKRMPHAGNKAALPQVAKMVASTTSRSNLPPRGKLTSSTNKTSSSKMISSTSKSSSVMLTTLTTSSTSTISKDESWIEKISSPKIFYKQTPPSPKLTGAQKRKSYTSATSVLQIELDSQGQKRDRESSTSPIKAKKARAMTRNAKSPEESAKTPSPIKKRGRGRPVSNPAKLKAAAQEETLEKPIAPKQRTKEDTPQMSVTPVKSKPVTRGKTPQKSGSKSVGKLTTPIKSILTSSSKSALKSSRETLSRKSTDSSPSVTPLQGQKESSSKLALAPSGKKTPSNKSSRELQLSSRKISKQSSLLYVEISPLKTLNNSRNKISPAPSKSSLASAKSSLASAKSSPALARKGPAPAKKSPSLAKKSPAKARKGLSPANKSPFLAKKSPAKARKGLSSAKKSPAPAKKSPALAKKSPALAKKSPALAKKSPALAKKSFALAEKSFALAEKSPVLAKKSPALAKKSPVPKMNLAPAKKTPDLAKKSTVSTKKTPPVELLPRGGQSSSYRGNISDAVSPYSPGSSPILRRSGALTRSARKKPIKKVVIRGSSPALTGNDYRKKTPKSSIALSRITNNKTLLVSVKNISSSPELTRYLSKSSLAAPSPVKRLVKASRANPFTPRPEAQPSKLLKQNLRNKLTSDMSIFRKVGVTALVDPRLSTVRTPTQTALRGAGFVSGETPASSPALPPTPTSARKYVSRSALMVATARRKISMNREDHQLSSLGSTLINSTPRPSSHLYASYSNGSGTVTPPRRDQFNISETSSASLSSEADDFTASVQMVEEQDKLDASEVEKQEAVKFRHPPAALDETDSVQGKKNSKKGYCSVM